MKKRNNTIINEKSIGSKKKRPDDFFESIMNEFYNAHLLEMLFEHGSFEKINKLNDLKKKKKNIILKKSINNNNKQK